MAPGDLVEMRYSWGIQLTTGSFQREILSDKGTLGGYTNATQR